MISTFLVGIEGSVVEGSMDDIKQWGQRLDRWQGMNRLLVAVKFLFGYHFSQLICFLFWRMLVDAYLEARNLFEIDLKIRKINHT